VDAKKRSKIEKTGFRTTSVREFLGLSEAESAIIELRLELADAVRERRVAAGLTQEQLAKAVGSSQTGIAKIEKADPKASLESMIEALVATGSRVNLRVV
jgi:DNA-binding XRE family transcriptional regulator